MFVDFPHNCSYRLHTFTPYRGDCNTDLEAQFLGLEMPRAKSGEQFLIAFIAKQQIFETHSCMCVGQDQCTWPAVETGGKKH